MRVPKELEPLVDGGIIDEVIRPLLSGKEALVYLVRREEEYRVAKVYKEASNRSFRQRAEYTEGRKVRNSRQQRAMDKGSKYGRAKAEAAWREAEVDAIYRLDAAGVRVPRPFDFVENVLVMELIGDPVTGLPSPRLVDVDLDRETAERVFRCLIRETVKMLCAGVVHGDLSDFNVLMGPDGPIIIDFPQWVDPAVNRNAKKLLVRDVNNLTHFLSRWIPGLKKTRYGPEMWDLYEKAALEPDTQLTGRFSPKETETDTMSLLQEIEAIERENREKREALGLPPRRKKKAVVVEPEPAPEPERQARKGRGRGDRPRGDRPREDRAREDRPREDRPREDRPREDRPAKPVAARKEGEAPRRRRRRPRKRPA